LIETLEDEEYPFSEVIQNAFKEYQMVLGLRDEDVEAIACQILPQSTSLIVTPSIPAPTPVVTSAPQSFTLDLGNNVQLEMITIPAGRFWMGSPQGEGYDRERPRHQVAIAPFWMSKYPNTGPVSGDRGGESFAFQRRSAACRRGVLGGCNCIL
jgi:formylglycine-generating enzyme required for sulfatase activity